MTSGGRKRALAAAFSLAVLAGGAPAQTNRGGISGTVFDHTGAIIPGATVTVTNLGTNKEQELITSDTGTYALANLEPVTYRVAVKMPAPLYAMNCTEPSQRRTLSPAG